MAIEAEMLRAQVSDLIRDGRIHHRRTQETADAVLSLIHRSALAEDTARAAEGQIPDGWKLVPAGATEAMQRAGMDKALRISLGGDYGWFDYMADLYYTMLAAAPAFPLTNEAADANR